MSTQTNRPNIIFCLSGQQRLDTCGCYGQKLPVTPVLDELAAQGIKFNHAFNTAPALAAFKAAVMTGRTPVENKVFCKGQALASDCKTIAKSFADAGYETSFIGHWGLGGTKGEAVPADKRGGFNGFWRASDDLNATSELFAGHVFDENNNKVEFNGWRSDKLTDFALEFLDKRDSSKPFFMTLSYGEPCISMIKRSVLEAREEDKLTDEQKAAKEAERKLAKQNGTAPNEDELVKTVVAPDEDKRVNFVRCSVPITIQVYAGSFRSDYMNHLAQCNSIDNNLGRLVEKLKATGEWDNTVIVFTAATGNHFGGRNLDKRCKGEDDYASSIHADSSQVPLVIAGGAIKDSKVVDHLVSTLSLSKTMLTVAGIDAEDLYGQNLLSLDDKEIDESEALYYYITQSRVARGIRTKQFVYEVSSDDLSGIETCQADRYRDDFMHDNYNDEYEINNLIRDICYTDIKMDLRKRLVDMIEKEEGVKVTIDDFISNHYGDTSGTVPTVKLV